MSRESGLYSNYADEVRVWAKKEIAKFEEEKKDLEKLIKSSLRHLPSMEEESKKLKEENEKLKKQLEEKEEEVSLINSEEMENEEKIAKLEEENKTLKEESEEMEYCNGVCCERSPKVGMSWWKSYGFNSPCKCAYTIKRQEENKKLKEEIKKNQQRNLDLMDFRCLCDDMSLSELSAECLNEEIKKLKKELDNKGRGIYICGMECSHCSLPTTEDDLYLSIECGELTCESCAENKKLKADESLAEYEDGGDAAVETLKFMGYKYNNGSWEEEEEDDE